MPTAHVPLLIAILLTSLYAAQTGEFKLGKPDITLNVDLVLVPVTVTDRSGATVTGIEREQFSIFEDKTPQRIVSFSNEEVPGSVGLVFDISGSMKSKMGQAQSFLRAFLRASNPADETFALLFAGRREAGTPFTSDLEVIRRTVQAARAGGSTALIDSLSDAIDRMRYARHTRKALIVVSDGMDNASRYSKTELKTKALESDLQIFAVSFFSGPGHRKPIELMEETRGLALLHDIAEATGGRSFTARDEGDVVHAARQIGQLLRDQYVLGYYAPKGSAGWRKIQVKVNLPNVRLHARSGYIR